MFKVGPFVPIRNSLKFKVGGLMFKVGPFVPIRNSLKFKVGSD
jgi:hypothetical protein